MISDRYFDGVIVRVLCLNRDHRARWRIPNCVLDEVRKDACNEHHVYVDGSKVVRQIDDNLMVAQGGGKTVRRIVNEV